MTSQGIDFLKISNSNKIYFTFIFKFQLEVYDSLQVSTKNLVLSSTDLKVPKSHWSFISFAVNTITQKILISEISNLKFN